MPFPAIQQEWIESLQTSLGIVDPKSKEELRSFLLSAYVKYDQFVPSYVTRNISFMSDNLYLTLSHATNPVNNPTGFGLGFGSFIGFLMKAEDAQVCKKMFSDQKTFSNINKCIALLKSISGVDITVVREIAQHMNTTLLDPPEIERYDALVQSI